VAEDGCLNLCDREPQLAVAGTVALIEQGGANVGKDISIRFQPYRVINVALGDAASQMTVDVLQVFRFAAVDIAREVEVVVVLEIGDLLKRHHTGVTRITLIQALKGIDDAVNLLLAEPVFWAFLHKGLRRIDHEDSPTYSRVLLVEHDDARRNTCAVKKICR